MAATRTDIKACAEQLRILYGLPPHDAPSNICRSDGYFDMSIQRDFAPETYLAAKELVQKEQRQWEQYRKAYMNTRQWD